jgi:hypothetical protein
VSSALLVDNINAWNWRDMSWTCYIPWFISVKHKMKRYEHLQYKGADPDDRAVKGLGSVACRGFEYRWGHGFLWVLCCQVEISASGWSVVQRSPPECGGLNVISKL